MMAHHSIIPAQAGIQSFDSARASVWTRAFAGVQDGAGLQGSAI